MNIIILFSFFIKYQSIYISVIIVFVEYIFNLNFKNLEKPDATISGMVRNRSVIVIVSIP